MLSIENHTFVELPVWIAGLKMLQKCQGANEGPLRSFQGLTSRGSDKIINKKVDFVHMFANLVLLDGFSSPDCIG